MPVEIERKYLVEKNLLLEHLPALSPTAGSGTRICQGYIPTDNLTTVRVRIVGHSGFLNLKGMPSKEISSTLVRSEFEYAIPLNDARDILKELCSASHIVKTRHIVPYQGFQWELDIFEGPNDGLIVAEVELEHEGITPELPVWISSEVTADPRFLNQNLATHPYCNWSID